MHCCSVRLFSNPDLQHTSRSWHLFVRLSVYFLTNIYLHKYGLFFILLDNGNDLNFQNIVIVVGWCLHLIFGGLLLSSSRSDQKAPPTSQPCRKKLPLYKNSSHILINIIRELVPVNSSPPPPPPQGMMFLVLLLTLTQVSCRDLMDKILSSKTWQS